jgi:hypothetical protein
MPLMTTQQAADRIGVSVRHVEPAAPPVRNSTTAMTTFVRELTELSSCR